MLVEPSLVLHRRDGDAGLRERAQERLVDLIESQPGLERVRIEPVA